jgi:NO-binding membrane sensor protein with MHYT domain
MNPIVTTSIDPTLAALSFAFAVIGSFIALNAASRIRGTDGRLQTGNILVAGIALGGIGVWTMHFIGMLALKMDTGSSYAAIETGISLIAAIAATSLSLGFAAKAPEKLGRLMVAGVLLGMSVVVMHYLGMYGLKIVGYVQWDFALVGLSVAIAVVAATAALWLAFNSASLGKRVAAAVIMGIAVCAMHHRQPQRHSSRLCLHSRLRAAFAGDRRGHDHGPDPVDPAVAAVGQCQARHAQNVARLSPESMRARPSGRNACMRRHRARNGAPGPTIMAE